jgi:uncharacterized protein (TIGR03435 family)
MRHVVRGSVLWLGACIGCFGQAPGPSFDAASIRAGDPRIGGEHNVQVSSGTITIRNQPFLFLVQWAYDVPPAQIDGPAWFRDTTFDIIAKAGVAADETQLRLMLRALLADRFGLKLHTESRTVQAYAITVAKGGPKFHESPTDGPFVLERASPVILNAHHARMLDLAQGISGEIGRPVVDATGLTGRYEIHMDLSPYLVKPPGEGGQGQLDMMGILFTGFQDLLGLKLESRKDSVEVLVIDHAEKTPTEN